jgi:hypothetical protein
VRKTLDDILTGDQGQLSISLQPNFSNIEIASHQIVYQSLPIGMSRTTLRLAISTPLIPPRPIKPKECLILLFSADLLGAVA